MHSYKGNKETELLFLFVSQVRQVIMCLLRVIHHILKTLEVLVTPNWTPGCLMKSR